MQADHNKIHHQLAIAKGQIEGILHMIDDDAYCLDISNQLLATIALLKKVNCDVLQAHLEHCVKHAEGEEKEAKIAEISALLKRLS